MEFYSLQFLIFLIISLIFYYCLPKKFSWIVLLTVSLIFYSFFGIKNFLFIFLVAAAVFTGSFFMQRISDSYTAKKDDFATKEERKQYKARCLTKKRIILGVVLAFVFGLLAILKYFEPILNYFLVLILKVHNPMC